MDKLSKAIFRGELKLFSQKDLREIRVVATMAGENLKQVTLVKEPEDEKEQGTA